MTFFSPPKKLTWQAGNFQTWMTMYISPIKTGVFFIVNVRNSGVVLGGGVDRTCLGGGFKAGQVKQYFACESQHQHGAFDKTGGFKYFLFSPLFGEDFQIDWYFSKGLVQPPTRYTLIKTRGRDVNISALASAFWKGGCFCPQLHAAAPKEAV